MYLTIIVLCLITVFISTIYYFRSYSYPSFISYNVLLQALLITVLFASTPIGITLFSNANSVLDVEEDKIINMNFNKEEVVLEVGDKDRRNTQDITIETLDGKRVHQFVDVDVISEDEGNIVFQENSKVRTVISSSDDKIITVRSIEID